jgi:hypothetical protein
LGDVAQLDLVLGEDMGVFAEAQAVEPLVEVADFRAPDGGR